MAIDLDDEILQDFLVEAGEILDSLGEQLVELEQSPGDLDLLNSIFRGFHTIKGGAGFLAISALVDICHNAEDVFNVLRQGDRQVTPDLMDVILQVVDIVNEMFGQVRSGNTPKSADQGLLKRLKSYAGPADAAAASPAEIAVETAVINETYESTQPLSPQESAAQDYDAMLDPEELLASESSSGDADEITEQEFEDLLDALHGKGGSPTVHTEPQSAAPAADDEISEDEFENLLDELHGKGKFSVKAETPVPASESGDITDEEFDKVLDALHGKGKFDATNLGKIDEQATVVKNTPSAKANAAPVDKPVVAPKPEPVAKPPADVEPENKLGKVAPAVDSVSDKSKAATPQADTTVRVDTQILDDIMNMVGELVLVRNRFQTLKANAEAGEQLSKAISNLDVVTADLQLAVMKTRMQPIKKVFGRFPRVVRDLARSLKKEIRLELVGEETDLDKNLVEALADPLVHLVRNAVDHGIESPDEREAKGKPREGVVILKASQEGDHIQLSIKDDGKGMNSDVLRAKVVEKGLMDEESAARLDEKECYNLIFLPGFSTKTEISDVSGRGVGMDVVKTRIAQMNGVVEIDSVEGRGSTILIKVPLTLAIMPTLMVKLRGQAFALPLASVLEILDLDLSKTNKVDGQLVVMVRNKALPLFYLSEWLVRGSYFSGETQPTNHVVVVNAGGRHVGFVVDQLIGQEEVVIKALGAKLHGLEGLAGATITGDGKIALILDVPGLMKKYAM
ncbi:MULTISPECIES: chemotaxis protein CheA [Methylomonas]|uniref:Chemotaxis protein CheA n=2 Tax=Methylomonas TaxID=416 RepID=A0A126T5H3_9GAMM|nr:MULTISPECIES: chemotaxis protein CheA [Methylomonas]AMK77341.1 chemotaxis protein CheA [Methylomonas denitrificans]OAI08824.1 chemotaxis protein CheA [Methylomonas methanica]TCV75687.1 two-component system chemotaxis sensor kinase CheA [Methylomonas methanica]